MCGSRGGFASSGASRERLRHPPLPRVELGRIWLPGRIWPLGAEPGALFSRPDCAWNPRRARLRRSCSGLGWLPAEGGAEGSGIIPGVMIPNSGIFPSPAPLALLPTLPSPALPWLSRSKVNPAPGLSVAPPAAAGAGGSSDPAGSAPGDAGGAGGSRGLLWSILVPHPGLFQEGGWEDGEGLGGRSRLLLAIPRKSRCPPQGAWRGRDEPALGRETAAPEGKTPGSAPAVPPASIPRPAGIIPHIPAPDPWPPPGLRDGRDPGGHRAPRQPLPSPPGPSTRHELPGK